MIALHGLPCGEVVTVKVLAEKDYAASCKDGNKYRARLSDAGRVVVEKQGWARSFLGHLGLVENAPVAWMPASAVASAKTAPQRRCGAASSGMLTPAAG